VDCKVIEQCLARTWQGQFQTQTPVNLFANACRIGSARIRFQVVGVRWGFLGRYISRIAPYHGR